ncbi:ROK family protein [Cellulosilyticum sp. I15G10I2]|uniref:ROK family protein n=1 Tax=Cellulosilyticum sp. I15G10I2 TaxID=1892843 RepID=UPI00085BE6CC|nr:ROK family protein [Cellulosilyticum sp. I15G10I2]
MKYIGVDLGGTNIVVGLVDEEGNIIKSHNRPTLKERTIEEIFNDIIEMCEMLISEFQLNSENLQGVGIGSPGLIDSKNGIIVYANNLKVKDFDAVSYINSRIGYKACIANDADCAALGEVVAGAAKGCSDAMIFTLGTGVGGGIIINGKIFSGYFPGGAEIGHQIIVKDGKLCSCGNKGCLESYASATGLINLAKEKAEAHKESELYKLVDGDMSKMNAKIPFDAAQMGDQVGIEVIDEYIAYLAIGIANAVNVFKPQVILLGGGVSKQEDNLVIPLTEKVKENIFGGDFKTQIKTAKLGNDAGLIGAAMLCAD